MTSKGGDNMTELDLAESGRLSEAVAEITSALDEFNRFDSPDLGGPRRAEWLPTLDQPLPEQGVGLDRVLQELSEIVIPHGLKLGAPGFSGWVTGAPTTSGTVAGLAAMVAGSQRYLTHSFNGLERIALDWLKQLLGFPGEWQGLFVSGGSVANLVGLGAALQWAFERAGCDPAREGLPVDQPWGVYASSEVHHVVIRAAGVLGLGRRSVASIPVQPDLHVDLRALRAALVSDRASGILPVAMVASAGTVNTGAVDPIEEMADLAGEFGTWLHVDGAYGLFGLLDPRVAPLYRGVERADSVAVDPHKWQAAPIGCGAAYVRDQALLARAFTTEPADYLEGSIGAAEVESSYDEFGVPYHHFGLEHSAPPRGALVWAILREIGAEGMRQRVIRHNSYARHLASRAKADDRLELLIAPVLSICCFRYRAPGLDDTQLDDLNTEIVHRLYVDGRYVPSTTLVGGRLAIRPCYINPRTTLADVDGLADRVCELGDELVGG